MVILCADIGIFLFSFQSSLHLVGARRALLSRKLEKMGGLVLFSKVVNGECAGNRR